MLRIKPNGSLRLVPGDVTSSGGVLPVSVAIHGDLMFAATVGGGGSNYTGFVLQPSGRLAPVAGSILTLPGGSQPGDVLFSGDGTKLAGTRVGTSLVDSFTVGLGRPSDRRAGIALPCAGAGPVRQRVPAGEPTSAVCVQRPQRRRQLGHRLSVSRFRRRDAVAGRILPFADLQTAPCWVEITMTGTSTVNTGSGTISRYSIAPSGALTLLGSTPVGATGGVGAVDARLSPRRPHPVCRREQDRRCRRVRRQRRQPDRAGQLPNPAAGRRHARRHRRQLGIHHHHTEPGGINA